MVDGPELIFKYFQNLSDTQKQQIETLGPFFASWNDKVNMVSRKDIDHVYRHHILHSMSIAKYISFKEGTTILDLGTGGGFPGIPLAILFPEVQFLLIDGKAKKIKVVNEIIEELNLQNVAAIHKRAEELKMKFDFVTARAVTRLNNLIPISLPLIKHTHNNAIPNGLLTLKGGNLKEEIKEVQPYHSVEKQAITDYFDFEYFQEKYLLYVPV